MKANIEFKNFPLARKPAARWKWMATSSATVGAAMSGSADAATVQIDLIGNQVTTQGSNFSPDFTGDGNADAPFTARSTGMFVRSGFTYKSVNIYNTSATTFPAFARTATPTGATTNLFYSVGVGSNFVHSNTGPQGPVSGLFPITFMDAKFNGGAATGGWVELRGFNSAGNPRNTVQAVRTVFDNASTTRPVGVTAGGSNTVIGSVRSGGGFVPVAVADGGGAVKASLKSKIKKLKKKIKKAVPSKKGRLKAKLKKLKKKLKALG